MADGTTTSTAELARRLAQEWDAAWAARDAEALAGMFTEEGTWEDPLLSRPISGRGELRRYFEGLLRAFPDLEVHQEKVFVDVDDDARVGTQWVIRGTLRDTFDAAGYAGFPIAPTGDRVDFTGQCTMTLREDRVAHVRQYVDYTTFQRQIGMLPPAGSRGERFLGRLQALGAKRRLKKNS
jgi:steroid delta-isomerase-like uncharacterized protein